MARVVITNNWYDVLSVIATSILGFKLYDFQIEILRNVLAHKRVLVAASRQLGKSVCIAILAIAFAISQPGKLVLIISTGERQGKELLSKRNYSIKRMFKRSAREAHNINNINPAVYIKEINENSGLNLTFNITAENAEEIAFGNESRIVVVPANPDTIAGFTADLVIVDECAKMPMWPDIKSAIYPMVSRVNGNIVVFSSVKGKNHFYEMMGDAKSPENPKGYQVLKYPITVNPPDDLDQLKHDLDESVFMEEYMLVPVDEAHSLFPYSMIEACATGTFEEWN